MQNISLRQIEYFIAVAETGQFSHAAKDIARSQSTITMAIRELEKQLRVELFARNANGVVLTSHGHDFLARSYRIIAEINAATLSVKLNGRDIVGSLTIGTKDSIAAYYLPGRLGQFRRAYPNVRVRVREMTVVEITEGLRHQDMDIGILAVRESSQQGMPNFEGLMTRVLDSHYLHLWVGENHPFLDRDDLTPADIAAEPYIMWEVDEYEQSANAHFAALGLKPNVVLSSASTEAIRSLVAKGAGVAVMPDMVYRSRSLEGSRIERLSTLEIFPGVTQICIAWSPRRPSTPPAEALRRFLLQEMTFQQPIIE